MIDISKINVLVACEESQRTCVAFRERGFNAFSCDIQGSSGGHPEWHIIGDALEVINGNCGFVTEDGIYNYIEGRWDLIIAHPPCTYLSAVGTRHLYPGGVLNPDRYEKGVKAAEFFMKILNADCEHVVVENPKQFKIFGIPKYDQIIHPWWFGDPIEKNTCLWLKHVPPMIATQIVEVESNCSQKKGEAGKSWYTQGGKDRQRNRSKTFPGIAKAFAQQFGDYIISVKEKGECT